MSRYLRLVTVYFLQCSCARFARSILTVLSVMSCNRSQLQRTLVEYSLDRMVRHLHRACAIASICAHIVHECILAFANSACIWNAPTYIRTYCVHWYIKCYMARTTLTWWICPGLPSFSRFPSPAQLCVHNGEGLAGTEARIFTCSRSMPWDCAALLGELFSCNEKKDWQSTYFGADG